MSKVKFAPATVVLKKSADSKEISPKSSVLEFSPAPKLVRLSTEPSSLSRFPQNFDTPMASSASTSAVVVSPTPDEVKYRRHELWAQAASKHGAKFVKKGTDTYYEVMKTHAELCEADPIVRQPVYRWKLLDSADVAVLDNETRKKYLWDYACRQIQGLLDNEVERTQIVRKTDDSYPAVKQAYIVASEEIEQLAKCMGIELN